MAGRIPGADEIVDAKDDVAADWRWSAGGGDGRNSGVETTAVESMMWVPIASDATRLRGPGFLYERGIVMATKKAAKKSTKKSSSKKSSSSRKYSPSAGKDVEREMKAMKQGKLKSGRSGKKVTSRKQAIAIGLSEARKEGKKVPPAPKR